MQVNNNISIVGLSLIKVLEIFTSVICMDTRGFYNQKSFVVFYIPIALIDVIICTFPRWQPFVDGRFASGLECKTSHSFRCLSPVSSTSLSLSFHMLRSSLDGAVPTIPGWVRPGNRTPDVKKEKQNHAITIYRLLFILWLRLYNFVSILWRREILSPVQIPGIWGE